ncbi:MAG TPA: MFS transporter [Steroidobacteraceae bacterium]|nr:MFS transporter [Steroidobacteraceae bacterium]
MNDSAAGTARGASLLACIDAAALRPRYWVAFGLIVLMLVCELFDFFVVSYLVSAIAPQWGLTFGQTTVMLLSAGAGAMVGALAFGWVADRFGRKVVVVSSALLCCVCAGSIAFVPDGDWVLFSLLRLFVGFGYGGAGASQFALVAEYTPVARRTLLTSSMGIPAGLGLLLASLVVTSLFPVLGWRGTAALAYLPILLVVAIAFLAPESPRWLIAAGRVEKARRVASSMLHIPADVSLSALPATVARRSVSLMEVIADRRRFFLIVLIQLCLGTVLTGVLLWGPTILAQLMLISPQKAAAYFVFISLSALAGRTAFTFLPHWIGRVPSGRIAGYVGAVMLMLAALLHSTQFAGVPLFFACLLIGQFFYDGAYSNLTTYAAELYPVRLGALAMGVSAAAGGAGKLLGPLALGLIAGTGNLVTPRATEQAVQPAFLFLAGCCLVVGLSYSVLGIETSRKPLALT